MREPIEKLNKDYVPPKEHVLEFKETDHPFYAPQGDESFFKSWQHFKESIISLPFDDDYLFVVRYDIEDPCVNGGGLELVVTIVTSKRYRILTYIVPIKEEDMYEVSLWLTARYKRMERVWGSIPQLNNNRETYKVNGEDLETNQPIQIVGARSASGFGTYVYGPDKDGDVLVSINGKNEYINEHHVSPL